MKIGTSLFSSTDDSPNRADTLKAGTAQPAVRTRVYDMTRLKLSKIHNSNTCWPVRVAHQLPGNTRGGHAGNDNNNTTCSRGGIVLILNFIILS